MSAQNSHFRAKHPALGYKKGQNARFRELNPTSGQNANSHFRVSIPTLRCHQRDHRGSPCVGPVLWRHLEVGHFTCCRSFWKITTASGILGTAHRDGHSPMTYETTIKASASCAPSALTCTQAALTCTSSCLVCKLASATC